ncbi:MAG: DUF3299 domain-containing protein [Thermoanaerobaculia bacterium]|nr:DUF3299 domain-containing protein [Thermoanaerobaculia bacterium]
MPDQRPTRAMLVLVACFVVALSGVPSDAAADERSSSVGSPEEGAGDQPSDGGAPSSQPQGPAAPGLLSEPVDVENATRPFRTRILSELGYENEDGELILDVMEGDYLYLTLLVDDAKGRPVRGLVPTVTPEGDSRFVPHSAVSDYLGNYRFRLQGGSMGEERVEILAGEAVQSVILNVISRRAAGYGWLGAVEGILSWDLLTRAEINWGVTQLSATFPDEVLARNGKTVKLAGFMLPLEMKREQKHFVLTSHPPGCFFHVPGGPAGSVEVFAKDPLEVNWEPVVLEGRFEVLETSTTGVLYRLHEARAAQLPAPVNR